MSERKPDEEMERQIEQMEKKSGQVQNDIDSTRNDWESKVGDQSVPGAMGEEEAMDVDRRSLDDEEDDED